MDEREVEQAMEIARLGSERSHYTDVDRALSVLAAEVRRLRERAVPALEWRREGGESAAEVGDCRLEVWDTAYVVRWRAWFHNDHPIAKGVADSIADGEAKAEAAFLRLVGVQK